MTERDVEKVQDVVKKVRALMKLSELTGTITKRSQGLLLQSLTPDQLVLAAEIMTESEKAHGNTK